MTEYPKIWNVPQYNDDFSGRETQLQDLVDILNRETDRAVKVVISGLPGVGKTQLAKRFAYLRKAKYGFVWWINAETRLEEDYLKLAEQLNIDITKHRFIEIRQNVREYLRKYNEGWLLIFDNINKPEDIIDYLPEQHTGAPGHIIVTSRDDIFWSNSYHLNPFIVKESENYLIKVTGQTDKTGAKRLAERLGNFPLALAQAAGYMRAHNKTYNEYLLLYEENHSEMLSRQTASDVATYTDYYRQTIRTTFQLLFNKIKENKAAIQLLFFCSFISAEAIPKFLLEAYLTKRHSFDEAYKPLRKYSILQRDNLMSDEDSTQFIYGESYSIHRLVQEFIIEQVKANKKKGWINQSLKVINCCFQPDLKDMHKWSQSVTLISHVDMLLCWVDKYKVYNETAKIVTFNAFNFCINKDMIDMVKKNFARLKIYMSKVHLKKVEHMKYYATFLIDWVLYCKTMRSESSEYSEVIAKIDESFSNNYWEILDDSTFVFDLKYYLANALLEKGQEDLKMHGDLTDINRSELLLKSLLRKISELDDQNRELDCLCRLGILYYIKKENALSLQYFYDAHILHVTSGYKFPNMSYAYNSMGMLAFDPDYTDRNLEEAKQHYLTSLKEVERFPLLSKTNRFAAFAHNGLTRIFAEQGNIEQAKFHYNKFIENIDILFKIWPASYLEDKKILEDYIEKSKATAHILSKQNLNITYPTENLNNQAELSENAVKIYFKEVKEKLNQNKVLFRKWLSNISFVSQDLLEQMIEKIDEFQLKNEIKPNESLGFLEFMIGHVNTLLFKVENRDQSPKTLTLTLLLKELINHGNQLLKDAYPVKNPPISINYEKEKKCCDEQLALDNCTHFLKLLREVHQRAFYRALKPKDIFISYAWPIGDTHQEAWTTSFIFRFANHLNTSGLRAHVDQIHSGCGNSLHGFMDKRIKTAHHIIVICNRTMRYKFETDGFTGACYEYLQYIERYRKERIKRFIIPLCLNDESNKPGLVGMFAEESVYKDGYLSVLGKVLKNIYEFGEDFIPWWQNATAKL